MKILRLGCPVKFLEINPTIFIISFNTLAYMNRVLEGRLWLLDNLLLMLKPFDGFTPSSNMHFVSEVFWVQLFNLPLVCMNQEIGSKIEKFCRPSDKG